MSTFSCPACGVVWPEGALPCVCGAYSVSAEAARSAPGDRWLGRMIDRRYVILEKLGAGGMGAVYRALDGRLDRAVAVKFLLPDQPELAGQGPEVLREVERLSRQRFAREAQALARIHHPSVVRLLDRGEHEGVPYLVEEYVAGRTLYGRGQDGPFELESEIKPMLHALAAGLGAAHAAGIVHRDVKPANVVIRHVEGQGAVPCLVDFGLAHIADATRITRSNPGTPLFMAPEQFEVGRPVDARIDVYALGALGYWMAAGRAAFTGKYLEKLFAEAPALSSVVPGIDPAFAELVRWALVRSPDQRCPSALAFSAALAARPAPPQLAPQPPASLVWAAAPGGPRAFSITPPRVSIGRRDAAWGVEPEVDLTSDDDANLGVSRRHAELMRTPEGWSIVDLDSANGTWVDGVRVVGDARVLLPDRAEVRVGRVTLRWSA